MRILLLLLLLFPLKTAVTAQTPAILLSPKPTEPDQRAARVLQHYLREMTGQPVEILSSLKVPGQGALVVIGNHPNLQLMGLQRPPSMRPDAYFLQGKNNVFLIAGGGEMGAEYGVYDLLERLGCRKYSPRDSLIPKSPKLALPALQPTYQAPAFPYRELHYEPAFDEAWARWHRLKTRQDKAAEWGLFVHTFHLLCPEEKYFVEHPEYFSWNGAQRSPGQLCLSNDTVKQIVIAALREKVREKPAARYWSVSQNDNYDYCKCARCAASDAQYGSPAGTLLAFVNAVAAAFPDKTISTLAYQYTRRAPKGIDPAPNVSVCLCSIECNRGNTIEEGCTDFARDLREWSELSGKLMVWDYVVQFRSYISPFPNWHTLQPNLQLFQQYNVDMMFEQGSGGSRSEFSDMRAYLLAKLMWNPKTNMDSVLLDFGKGYYGAGQPAVWGYIHDLTEQLQRVGNRLWIYDIPQNEPFLDGDLLGNHLGKLLDAETLLRGDSVRRRRLLAARLPISFARVERAKTDSLFMQDMLADSPEQFRKAFQSFAENCRAVGFESLHEMGYSPEQYVDDFVTFLEKGRVALRSTAFAPVLDTPASPTYAKGNANELTNGCVGETDYRYNWLGFQGADLKATVQMKTDSITHIAVSFLQDQQSWVFFPERVVFEISENGVFFQKVQEETLVIRQDGKKAVKTVEIRFSAPRAAKFVRVTGVNVKTCPAWHSCNGNPCWIFADEIVVY
jgi:hypothetical protein